MMHCHILLKTLSELGVTHASKLVRVQGVRTHSQNSYKIISDILNTFNSFLFSYIFSEANLREINLIRNLNLMMTGTGPVEIIV